MRKYKSAYLKPYIRIKTKKDINCKNCDYITYIRLGFPHFKYVMLQRATNHIVACGRSKLDMLTDIKIFEKCANTVKRIQQKTLLKIRKGGI